MENNKRSSWLTEDYVPDLVSVIIPTYNREVYLHEAITSVIAQTYRPIQCIIVDDGSTDNTRQLVVNFNLENKDGFSIKYIFQENLGSQVARNTGTKASSGEFIQYLDSDDLLFPAKIKNQVAFLYENKHCDGVFGGWCKGTIEENELIPSYATEDLLTQLFTEHCIHTLSFLFRRTIVEKIGPWDINVRRNQEIDFQLRGLLEGGNYQFQPQIGGLWRIHNGERIANLTGLKDLMAFYQKWERILSAKELFNQQMGKNISAIYYWACLANKSNRSERVNILKECIRLNPEVDFIKSRKMKWLLNLFGENIALRCWLDWNKLHQLKQELNKLLMK